MRFTIPRALSVVSLLFILMALTGCGLFFTEDYYSFDKDSPESELVFSYSSGFYPSEITLELSSSYTDDIIYYTLDGSPPGPEEYSITTGYNEYDEDPDPPYEYIQIDPIEESEIQTYTKRYLYDSPIVISSTTLVRACIYKNGVLPGKEMINTYFIGEDTNLAIFSLVIDPADLFDDMTGIYVEGNNPSNELRPRSSDDFPFNFYQGWEKPVHMEFFDENRDLVIKMDAGISIFGGASRIAPQKSLAIFARSKYGPNNIPYAFFGNNLKNNNNEAIINFKSFILRTSGDDWYRTMIRDAVLQGALDGMDVDRQAYRPAVVFINGEYYGIHNIREKINEDYLAAHYDYVDPDKVDILESYDSLVSEGSNTEFLALIDYVENN
ncbi:MAG: CotH kinase family protein, partial [Spirochaetaceae bacterium]|nr:CotH kinase family protein [Spirochaetaceae bacterium]